MQNKCIRFCWKLGNKTHVGVAEFNVINWLPTRKRFGQCLFVYILTSLLGQYLLMFVSRFTRRSLKKLCSPNQKANRDTSGQDYGIIYLWPLRLHWMLMLWNIKEKNSLLRIWRIQRKICSTALSGHNKYQTIRKNSVCTTGYTVFDVNISVIVSPPPIKISTYNMKLDFLRLPAICVLKSFFAVHKCELYCFYGE